MPPVLECVCIRCAQRKLDPYDACPACGFTPATNEDYAKTIILSESYVIFDNDRTRPPERLREAWAALKAGTFEFDPLEVSEVTAYFALQDRYFRSLTKANVACELTFHFGPMLGGVLAVAAFGLHVHGHPVAAFMLGLTAFVLLLTIPLRIYWGTRELPDQMEHWLQEPRAVETSPASGAAVPAVDLPPEAAALFQRYDRVAIRHTGVLLSTTCIGEVTGKPNLIRIGQSEHGDIAVDRLSGEVLELGPSGGRYRRIASYVTEVCCECFPHLRPNPPAETR